MQTNIRFNTGDDIMKTKRIHKSVTNNYIMLIIATIIILTVSVFIHSSIANARESKQYEKTFTTIEIEQGTTLTSLADTYAKPGQDRNEYIEEVQLMNNMTNTSLKAGCYLIIPVYIETEK